MKQTCGLCNKYSSNFYCAGCIKTKIDEHNEALNNKAIETQENKAILSSSLQKLNTVNLYERKIRTYKTRIELLKKEIHDTKQQIEQTKTQVKHDKKRNSTQKRALGNALDVFYALEGQRTNSENKQITLLTIDNLAREISTKSESLKRGLKLRLRQKRELCCSVLLSTLPISAVPISRRLRVSEPRLPDQLYIIHDRICFPISGNFENLPTETVAAGLGYIALIIRLLSFYLRIPLPYPITHKGSRSVIIDPQPIQTTSENNIVSSVYKETVYPLFKHASQQEMFQTGLRLLDYNISQICVLQGIQCPSSSPMLLKLYLLIRSNNLGTYGAFPTLSEPISSDEIAEHYYANDNQQTTSPGSRANSARRRSLSNSNSNPNMNDAANMTLNDSKSRGRSSSFANNGYSASEEQPLSSRSNRRSSTTSSTATTATTTATQSSSNHGRTSANKSNKRHSRNKNKSEIGLGESIYFGYVPVEEDDADGGWENIIVDK